MITVNTNVNNLKLQRNLNSVNSAMQSALNRISTGYKINNASDDAAGLVISKALDVQNRGLNVANQNAQMATNLLSVADGALGQMGELTMRIRDLATQSANGGYSDSERKAISLEAKELTKNLEQLVKGTKFNDYNIFDTSPTTARSGPLTTEEITTEVEAINQGYEIVKTAQQLKAALTAPDALNNTNKKVMLFGDINLDDLGIVDGNNWVAVGTYLDDGSTGFKGTFDGNGHTISNLKINKPTTNYQGLFGYTKGATIKNVGLENIDVKGQKSTGGLVGGLDNLSTIENSYSTGNITGSDNTGGLAGWLDISSTIENSHSTGNVTGGNFTGGLAGWLYTSSTIQNSYSTGNVTGLVNAGGLTGYLDDSSAIQNSYSTGNVTGINNTGGLVGSITNSSNIQDSYSTGNVTGKDSAGGLVGTLGSSSVVQNSYSGGKVEGEQNVGGLIGGLNNSSVVKNSYSTGDVAGNVYTGGLVGYLASNSSVQNSYSKGRATGANFIGGLVGGMSSGASIKNAYSTGDVFSSSKAVVVSVFGGLVGAAFNNVSISNSYFAGQNKATVGVRGGLVGEIGSGGALTLNNYAYATQTASGVINGNGIASNKGTILGTEQTSGQNEAFFNNRQNIKNLLDTDIGANQWNLNTLPPKLAWQKIKEPLTFQIGTDGSALSAISMDLGFGLGGFRPSFTSAVSSRKTMEMCDELLKQINTKRGEIGANTNIISSIVDGNTITNENLTASKSRIQDADIARESAVMVKNQILEQATSSLLSQSSNINGQLALQLLSGLGGRK